MSAAFDNDEDIHTLVASQVNGVPLDEVTGTCAAAPRPSTSASSTAKVRSASPKASASRKKKRPSSSTATSPPTPASSTSWSKRSTTCRRKGYVTTILGRRRAMQGVRPVDPQPCSPTPQPQRSTLPERTAVNAVIQGSAADLIKLAMIRIHRRLRDEKSPARMLLQIHDELLFETPESDIENLAKLVRDEMQNVMQLRVPLKVDVKSGPNWAACE